MVLVLLVLLASETVELEATRDRSRRRRVGG